MQFLINIDVDDLERAIDFYRDAFGRRVGRHFSAAGVGIPAAPVGHGYCLLEFRGRGYDEICR